MEFILLLFLRFGNLWSFTIWWIFPLRAFSGWAPLSPIPRGLLAPILFFSSAFSRFPVLLLREWSQFSLFESSHFFPLPLCPPQRIWNLRNQVERRLLSSRVDSRGGASVLSLHPSELFAPLISRAITTASSWSYSHRIRLVLIQDNIFLIIDKRKLTYPAAPRKGSPAGTATETFRDSTDGGTTPALPNHEIETSELVWPPTRKVTEELVQNGANNLIPRQASFDQNPSIGPYEFHIWPHSAVWGSIHPPIVHWVRGILSLSQKNNSSFRGRIGWIGRVYSLWKLNLFPQSTREEKFVFSLAEASSLSSISCKVWSITKWPIHYEHLSPSP